MREYFPHDTYASCDIRLRRLQLKLGLLAIGLYWKTIEELFRNGNRLTPEDIEALTLENGVTDDLMQGMLRDFGLFGIDEFGCAYSEEVAAKMEAIAEKQQQRKEAAAARWSKKEKRDTGECERNATALRAECEENAVALRSHCARIAIKENKRKENKIVDTTKKTERKPQAASPSDEGEEKAAVMVADTPPAVLMTDGGREMEELEEELRRLCQNDDSVRLLIARRSDYRPLDPASLAALLAMIPEFAAQEALKSSNQRGKTLALHFVNWLARKAKIEGGRSSTPAEREQRYRDETERELLAGLYPEKL